MMTRCSCGDTCTHLNDDDDDDDVDVDVVHNMMVVAAVVMATTMEQTAVTATMRHRLLGQRRWRT
jgi:hypothetical protein